MVAIVMVICCVVVLLLVCIVGIILTHTTVKYNRVNSSAVFTVSVYGREVVHYVDFGDYACRAYSDVEHNNLDYLGHYCSQVITWADFPRIVAGGHLHHFTPWGFLYDERGVYTIRDTIVGFATEDDVTLYLGWCEEQHVVFCTPTSRSELTKCIMMGEGSTS